jgi:LPS O-antigen subunit length determinant protein (WzzB/FepE family)
MHRGQKRLRKQMQHPHEEGKQSVNDLLKSGVSTDKIELPDGSAKDFCKVAKKFGVDYAIRKDKTQDPPRYIVFFKAKDTEVLDQVVKEYISVTDKKHEKASVREQLKQEKAAARAEAKEKAKTMKKQKRKRKERTEGR